MISLKSILLEILSEREDDIDWDLYDDLDGTYRQTFSEFLAGKKRQSWKLIQFSRLKKIWEDYVKYGHVRDTRGLDDIEDILKKNTLKIYSNTLLCGHTRTDPSEYFEDYGVDDNDSKFFDFLEAPNGQLRISDYATDKLMNKLAALRKAKSYEEKLLLIDQMLNIVHQRSDLASWFIEGGSRALATLSGVEN